MYAIKGTVRCPSTPLCLSAISFKGRQAFNILFASKGDENLPEKELLLQMQEFAVRGANSFLCIDFQWEMRQKITKTFFPPIVKTVLAVFIRRIRHAFGVRLFIISELHCYITNP